MLSMLRSRSTSLMQDHAEPHASFPTNPNQYEILEDCGRGASASVHRALCLPLNQVVAIKKCNLDLVEAKLQDILREAATMRLYNHPNIVPLYCSFVHEQDLWLVMRYMEGGSMAHILQYAHREGLEEVVIATVMHETLRGLEYLHKQGGIHRDIKAGNILLDSDGTVQLGDFGVATTLERARSWGHGVVGRTSSVGTPCWMAPEVLEQEDAYTWPADIWSFGITIMELAHGHAPFSHFPPLKVLMKILQDPSPQLEDRVGQRTFSKSMREVVSLCLQKDPARRPPARMLLEHKFFRQARDKAYLAKHLLAGLPSLTERVRQIRTGNVPMPIVNPNASEARSMSRYVAGVADWNFELSPASASSTPRDSPIGSLVMPSFPSPVPAVAVSPSPVSAVAHVAVLPLSSSVPQGSGQAGVQTGLPAVPQAMATAEQLPEAVSRMHVQG